MNLPVPRKRTEPRVRSALDMVAEFMDVMDASRDPGLNTKFLNEELLEFEGALTEVLKEGCDVIYTRCCVQLSEPRAALDPDTDAAFRRTVSILYRFFGRAQVEEAFRRVHTSNMSKLVDGKPLRREDGKIAKGPNYKPPVLTDLV